MARAEENRLSSQNDFSQLNDKLSVLVDTMRTEHDLMMRLAEGQKGLRDALTKVAEGSKSAGGEEATRALKHIDQNLVRMIEENARGRAETVQELRSELRILARTVAALREGGNG